MKHLGARADVRALAWPRRPGRPEASQGPSSWTPSGHAVLQEVQCANAHSRARNPHPPKPPFWALTPSHSPTLREPRAPFTDEQTEAWEEHSHLCHVPGGGRHGSVSFTAHLPRSWEHRAQCRPTPSPVVWW